MLRQAFAEAVRYDESDLTLLLALCVACVGECYRDVGANLTCPRALNGYRSREQRQPNKDASQTDERTHRTTLV